MKETLSKSIRRQVDDKADGGGNKVEKKPKPGTKPAKGNGSSNKQRRMPPALPPATQNKDWTIEIGDNREM